MRVFSVLLFILGFNLIVMAQLPPSDVRYQLVFEDEFDADTVDKTKWASAYTWNQTGEWDLLKYDEELDTIKSYCGNIPSGVISYDKYGYRMRNFENCEMDTTGTGTMKIISKNQSYSGEVWRFPECLNYDAYKNLYTDSLYLIKKPIYELGCSFSCFGDTACLSTCVANKIKRLRDSCVYVTTGDSCKAWLFKNNTCYQIKYDSLYPLKITGYQNACSTFCNGNNVCYSLCVQDSITKLKDFCVSICDSINYAFKGTANGWTADSSTCLHAVNKSFNFTTGFLTSHQTFRYGYYEIRCKIERPNPPKTKKGIGPNFWMWSGDDRDSVSYSEIDIFEFSGAENKFKNNLHYGYDTIIFNGESNKDPIPINDNSFYTYSCWWTPEWVKFYIDNVVYDTLYLWVDKLAPMNLVIDVNLPLHTLCDLVDNNTKFPHYYEIDYVRIYQSKNCKDLIVSQNSDYQSGQNGNITVVPSSIVLLDNNANYINYHKGDVTINGDFYSGNNTGVLISQDNHCMDSEPGTGSLNRAANSVPVQVIAPPDPLFLKVQKNKYLNW